MSPGYECVHDRDQGPGHDQPGIAAAVAAVTEPTVAIVMAGVKMAVGRLAPLVRALFVAVLHMAAAVVPAAAAAAMVPAAAAVVAPATAALALAVSTTFAASAKVAVANVITADAAVAEAAAPAIAVVAVAAAIADSIAGAATTAMAAVVLVITHIAPFRNKLYVVYIIFLTHKIYILGKTKVSIQTNNIRITKISWFLPI